MFFLAICHLFISVWSQFNGPVFYLISQYKKYHNTLCLFTKILHKHCLYFLLRLTMIPKQTGNSIYAKFWMNKQRVLWYFLYWLIVKLFTIIFFVLGCTPWSRSSKCSCRHQNNGRQSCRLWISSWRVRFHTGDVHQEKQCKWVYENKFFMYYFKN